MRSFLKLFERRTHGRNLLPEIDGLRFIAIMSVVFFHLDVQMWPRCPESLKSDAVSVVLHNILAYGNFGVPLFFGISGFILALPMIDAVRKEKPGLPLREYYMRRITRIEPPYIINMCVLAMIFIVFEGRSVSEILNHLAASLTYSHNIIYGRQSIINAVAWSLEVEVQFYLLAPFLVGGLFLLETRPRRFLLVASSILGCFLEASGWIPFLSIATVFQYFLVGVLAADLYLEASSRGQRACCFFDFGVIAGMILLWASREHLASVAGAATWFLVLCFLCSAVWGRFLRKFLVNPFVYLIGGMCYTIYLWHGPLWRRAWRTFFGYEIDQIYWRYYFEKALILVPLILIVSAFLFLIFEKPFMRRDWYKTIGSYWNRLKSN